MQKKQVWKLLTVILATPASIVFANDEPLLITVTGTREEAPLAETPASISVISGESVRRQLPVHPSQAMSQIPGAWVNITGGEGHQTAIRQPLTTSPVYLYLEDGIPTRSTGFFNHNALYEVNLPQAGGIEVTRGPGTALYGSDAIGGVINVLTRPAPTLPEADASLEVGSYGWSRLLLSGGDKGVRGDLNLTRTDGWRDATGYTRESGTLRWDRALSGGATLKTVLTGSQIDQQTAGSSAISYADYINNPTINYTPISYRNVSALRLSSAYEKAMGDGLISITPYFRNNDMDLLANWSLVNDPSVSNSKNYSVGLLAKYRHDFVPMRARLITGVDIDHSPGSRYEQQVNATRVGNIYTSYTTGKTLYDYNVTYQGVSPYVHGELSPVERLRITGGLRYDSMSFQYDNKLADDAIGTTATRYYGHVGDQARDFSHLSPKLGATFAFTPNVSGFAAYNHAFRAPSEGQLFRPGTGSNATKAQDTALAASQLKPVKVDSYELGMRGRDGILSYELSAYYMTKTDDIVSYQPTVTDPRVLQNAGKTLHRGIELGLGAQFTPALRLNVAYSRSKHSYEEWVNNTTSFNGKEMEQAPRHIANTRLNYAPANWNGGNMMLEWVSLGSYWMQADNTSKYGGHNLFNLALNMPLDKQWGLFASVTNLTNKRFAESATNSGYAPGLPRMFYAGIRYNWQK